MKHHRDLVIELSDDEATKNVDDNGSDCIIEISSCEEEKRDNTVCEKKVGSIYNAVARRCNEYSSDSKRFRTLLNSSSLLKKDDDHYESDVLFARQLHENEKKSHNRENVEAIRYTKCSGEEKNSVLFDEDIDYSAPVPMTNNQYDDDSVIARFLQEEEEKKNKHYSMLVSMHRSRGSSTISTKKMHILPKCFKMKKTQIIICIVQPIPILVI